MMPGIEPERVSAIKDITKNIKCDITTDYKNGGMLIMFHTSDEKALRLITMMLKTMSGTLATQFSVMFSAEVKNTEGDLSGRV